MKLRVRHNSIRLRLSQSDITTLKTSGKCWEAIHFPGGSRLEYVLRASSGRETGVIFTTGVVSISVPEAELAIWHSTDQIGIQAAIEVRPGKMLDVLIEKDFKCLDERVTEDQSDMFENPLAARLSC
jgi:hypothetical protein